MPAVLGYTELPLVSCDFNHDPRSAVVDGCQTSVCTQNLITVLAWFDNEWGYANRMLDTATALMRASLSGAGSSGTQIPVSCADQALKRSW